MGSDAAACSPVRLLTSVTSHWTRVPQNILTITSMCHKCPNVVISALLVALFDSKTQIRRPTDVLSVR